MQYLKKLVKTSGYSVAFVVIQLLGTSLVAEAAGNPVWEEAIRQYNAGNYAAALAGFHKISEKNPTDPSTHYMLGQCYKGLNKTQQAIVEFTWVSKSSDAHMQAIALGALKKMGQNTSSVAVQPGSGPPRDFINDSAAQTVSFAYKNGWVPCTAGCLTFAKSGWHHHAAPGHPDSDQWMSFPYQKDGISSEQMYNQKHVGHIIKATSDAPATDAGPCSVCHGLGWVRYK